MLETMKGKTGYCYHERGRPGSMAPCTKEEFFLYRKKKKHTAIRGFQERKNRASARGGGKGESVILRRDHWL